MQNIENNQIIKKTLGDEMKEFEGIFAKQVLDDNLPILVRIDGKTFSTFTRGLKKPFDERLSNAMIETTNFLVEKSGAQLGYTQSDEITLVFFKLNESQQPFLGARVQKLTSVLASMATAKFNQLVLNNIEEKAKQFAFFDARVWTTPTLKDAARVLMWRQEDAIKNSISMAAHAVFGDKALHKKTSTEKIEMLKEKNIDWNAYAEHLKSGMFCSRFLVEETLSDEMKKFKSNEGKDIFFRTEIKNFTLPRISKTEDVTETVFGSVLKQRELVLDVKKKRKL